ncbi:MAG: putative amidophosphoribosyltransferase [Candidatus Saccharibacteria bacterium]|nr:putative amidophosphoribosyltransferase [Candidatus Saccharibacteria bacterium]
MIDTLLSYIAPHLCCGCGKIGALLCDDCKYNINNDASVLCIACGIGASDTGICKTCDVAYTRAWCVGERSGVLQRLIGDYKFQNMYAAYRPLALLLIEHIDQLPSTTVVVPIPTVASHVRERGYDHTLLLAKQVAKHRDIRLRQVITRTNSSRQRGASGVQRVAQAKVAFKVTGKINPAVPYLLIDDVVTTGATIKYAAEALRAAGATQIWVAVIARQLLD